MKQLPWYREKHISTPGEWLRAGLWPSREQATGAFRFARAQRRGLTVRQCLREGRFNTEAEAQGAFTLAYQQWLDGAGNVGMAQWMGLSAAELDAWLRDSTLPEALS